MNVAATLLATTEEEVVSYFKNRKAFSPQTAVAVNFEDLKRNLATPDFLEENLLSYNFLKSTSDGKYYLDQQIYSNNSKSLKIFLILLSFLLALSLILSTLFL